MSFKTKKGVHSVNEWLSLQESCLETKKGGAG